ncbi:MAG: discoidin domain-containing protein [Planctomycetes bacterium]|nr:discoidin domain-containing protein [Planctomycetota bacterium]
MKNQVTLHLLIILVFAVSLCGAAEPVAPEDQAVYPGADERTPAYSQYFSWINNTNEGSTEAQTLANLDFFKWLNEEYGMVLDIYVISAGAIDKAGRYGKMDSDAFRRQFPNGFGPIYEKAKSMGTRLGTWGGPDGFGDTPEEEQARIDMMVELCRDYEFILLKFDGVVGGLRPEKQDAFVRMMTECRKHSPDLILLNHRLKLGKGLPHATTYLLGGAETYIDVHMVNNQTAPHNRAGAISRRVVPDLVRLTEDHGVCISSCLDYWEDDLILQAFNRNLILAPQLYGNPWFLRDAEYPRLARIFNLARQYRDIMIDGMVLPEASYGEKAVVRGDESTRLLTLRNLTWEPIVCRVKLDEEIGLSQGTDVELRQYHPTERIIGTFKKGDVVDVEVLPFRSCLLMATSRATEFGITGCDYEVVRDVPGKPVIVKLLAMPGEKRQIELVAGDRTFKSARISRRRLGGLVKGKSTFITFPGRKLKQTPHRKLGDLASCAVPADAEALYEATCFAANNNALEARALERSGSSQIPQVVKAREAFLDQPLFDERGLWDKNLFDGNDDTAFYTARRVGMAPLSGGSLRLDLGELTSLDRLVVRTGSEYALQPFKYDETIRAQVSSDLKHWTPMSLVADKTIILNLDPKTKLRYIRFNGTPDKIAEIKGYRNGKKLDRSQWRASTLFARYSRVSGKKAWQYSFTLNEIPRGSYLAIALNGEHGIEGAYAAIRVNGKPVGSPDRSVSYPANTWEYPARKRSSNYTYYVPLTEDMTGAKIDAVVLGMRNGSYTFKPEVWITAYPAPFSERVLTLTEE